MVNTPVAFFIFNRPVYTEQAFAAIAAARPRKLLVVADGPRTEQEAALCERTRSIIKVDWDCEVLTNYSETNLGCRGRMSSGITWVFSQVEEAILIEDDCVPAPSFFPFCEMMLERFRHDTRVMMVTGSNWSQTPVPISESYFFSKYFNIWGWATWRRAWDLYDVNIADWPRLKAEDQLPGVLPSERARNYYMHSWDSLVRVDTWDYQWSYACLFNHGLCVVPAVNLISNVGSIGHHFQGNVDNIALPTSSLDVAAIKHPIRMLPEQRYDAPLFAKNEALLIRRPVPLIVRAFRRLFRILFRRS